MQIEKKALEQARYKREIIAFRNARSALKVFLTSMKWENDELILLPAYIGWSPREGSGVFDPINELHLPYEFYALDNELNIDVKDLEFKLKSKKVKLLMLIHYFGFVDPHYSEIMSLAKQLNILVMEDEAHALYTDLVGGKSGRLGQAAIFSLHKMLPFPDGGILCLNDWCINPNCLTPEILLDYPFMKYDLYAIARKRIENSALILWKINRYRDEITPLHASLDDGIVPQTLPIILNRAARDIVYREMNRSGFGVISLYHTLIDQIDRDRFPSAHQLSKKILNLPVHQDVQPQDIEKMIARLIEIIKE